MNANILRVFRRAAILCGLLASLAAAVGPSGTIVGTVTDPDDRVVPGAKIIVRSEDTNASREARSSALGEYAVPLLAPGRYEVKVEAAGFRQALYRSVNVEVNRTVRLDVHLELGEVVEQVVVTETPPPLQSDTSALGHVVDRTKIVSLPLNERNFLSFALLVPGAQLPAEGSQNSTQGAAVSVNGAREQSNNYFLNGVDNNDLVINIYSALPSLDAVREFQVQSSNSSAEFGRTGGAQINVVLKSGSNELHGTAFGFVRNRHLDAKNFFDLPDCTAGGVPGSCAPVPRLDRSQFGATLGGAIRRDKTFYFLSYEGLRLRQAVTREATVPSQAHRAAALTAVPAAQRNPAGEAILTLYPAANAGPDLVTSNRYAGAPVLRDTMNQILVKLDHHFRDADSLSGHYVLSDEDRYNPYDPFFAFTNLPGFGSYSLNRGHNAGLTWIHSFSYRLANEARLGYNRLGAGIFQESRGRNRSEELGFPAPVNNPAGFGYPNVVVAGFDGIGEPLNTPQQRHDNTYHFANTLAWNPAFAGGRHRFKFGADIRQFRMHNFLDLFRRGMWQFFGVFTGDPVQDLLRGLPTFALRVQGDSFSSFRTTGHSAFLQDDIMIHRRFVLNAGLRYEYNSPVTEAHDRLSVPDLSAASLNCAPAPDCQFLQVGTSGIPRSVYRPDRNNLAPRIGFAWRPLATDRFVIRSAYGIFYDVGILNANVVPRFNPPFFEALLFLNSGSSTIQNIFDQLGFPPQPSAGVFSASYRDGYMQQWNLNLQYEARPGWVLDLAYVGSKGTRLLRRSNPNQPRPGGLPPYPQFGAWQFFESGASSVYHSLQFRTERRVANGLTLLAAYTWSKSIDDASALLGTFAEPGFPQDSGNLRGERGLSNFDARHRLVASYVYALPWGKGRRWLTRGPGHAVFGNWIVSGIWTVQSGRPFTVNRAIDQSGTGTFLIAPSDRPDVIANPFVAGPVAAHPDPQCHASVSQGGRAADVVRDPSSWFNPCAFAPAPGRFGSTGRNSLTGPGLFQLDFAALKEFPLGSEARRLQLRFEFFNLPNHPNFDLPDRISDSPTFGRVRSANAFGNKPPRQIQLGMKFIF
jgi:hypothetical protein